MAQSTFADDRFGGIGYGMMGLTWSIASNELPSTAQSFDALDAAIDSGATFFNGGEIYGTPDRNSNHLLREYFEKHPQQASKVVLSIKGGFKPGMMEPDGSEVGARRSVEDSIKQLGGSKKIDIFEYARLDPNTPVEETMRHLKTLKEEGKIGGVGLSEVRASTIERANKIVPISGVEVELSMWTPDVLRNGVAETCARLNIPIVAYSPLARGALTFDASMEKLPEGDFRTHMPKLAPDALKQNLKINQELEALAKKKSCTKAQIGINWVRALSGRKVSVYDQEGNEKEVTLGTIIPIPGSSNVERIQENSKVVDLTDEEMHELLDIVQRNPTVSDFSHLVERHSLTRNRLESGSHLRWLISPNSR